MPECANGQTRLLGLLASPSRHSLSPVIYNAAFAALGLNLCYLCFDVDISNLKDAMEAVRTLEMPGVNFSMPNKTEAVQYMDSLSDAAQLIGSVNTVISRNGALEGHNTDGVGFFDSLREKGVEVKGMAVTQFGIGGAGAAIAVQAVLDGARQVTVFNKRDAFWESGEALVARILDKTGTWVQLLDVDDRDGLAAAMESSQMVINATNVGMGRLENLSIVEDASMFRTGQVVADCIYHPPKTRLLQLAEAQGCRVFNGDGMLLHQAAANFKMWTGLDLPLDLCRKAMLQAN